MSCSRLPRLILEHLEPDAARRSFSEGGKPRQLLQEALR
jgi:hypothetical protein